MPEELKQEFPLKQLKKQFKEESASTERMVKRVIGRLLARGEITEKGGRYLISEA